MQLVKLPCLCGTVRQAARALTTIYDQHLRPVGIRSTQFVILQALSLHPGLRNADLVAALALDQTTLTRTLTLMAKTGWIEVADRPSGREKCWSLTAAGSSLLGRAIPLWEQAQRDSGQRLGKRRMARLHHDLFDLARAAGA